MRRLLFILLALLLIGAITVGVWYLFFRDGALMPGTGAPGGSFGTGGQDAELPPLPDVGVPVGGAGQELAPRLFKITDAPVALGAIALPVERVVEENGATTTVRDTEIRFVDRATGNLYRHLLEERTLERLTNRTLPGIQEAEWADDGSRVFLRFLADDRTETYALPIDGGEGYLLEPDLSGVVASGASVLAILPSTNGAIGTRAALDGSGPSTLFSTELSSLRFHAAGSNYTATTRASASLPGYAFFVTESGTFTRLLGPLPGLTVLPSPSGTRFLYSSLSGGSFELSLLSVSPAGTTVLPLATMSDKCAWATDEAAIYCAVPRTLGGTLPDDWYQGQVATSDRIWKIDLDSRIASLVFDPLLLAEEDIDAVRLTLDSSEEVLVFTNRRDGALWAYDL